MKYPRPGEVWRFFLVPLTGNTEPIWQDWEIIKKGDEAFMWEARFITSNSLNIIEAYSQSRSTQLVYMSDDRLLEGKWKLTPWYEAKYD